MRRDEREVTDIAVIADMLDRCDTVTVGINAEGAPYLVPMTFGSRIEDGTIVVYLHCASEGRKIALLAADNRVCVQGHIYVRTEQQDGSITALYESVTGSGRCETVTDNAQKIDAMKLMLAHYKSSGFPVTSCKGLPRVTVLRIPLDEVCGKCNPPKE